MLRRLGDELRPEAQTGLDPEFVSTAVVPAEKTGVKDDLAGVKQPSQLQGPIEAAAGDIANQRVDGSRIEVHEGGVDGDRQAGIGQLSAPFAKFSERTVKVGPFKGDLRL